MMLLASCVPQATARVDGGDHAMALPAGLIRWSATPLSAVYQAPTRNEILEATAPGDPAEPFQFANGEDNLRGNSLDCLTAAVYYEARSETLDGQRAVAQVVLNRARHPAFPNSVCGVVYQGSQRRTGCQFSFTCDGSMQRGVRNAAGWETARQVASAALSGFVHSPVGLATHYHTTAIRPWWAPSLTRAITVGAHIFYRWPGRWGDPTSFRQPVFESSASGPVAIAAAPAIDPGPRPAVETVNGVTIHRGGPRAAAARPLVQVASAGQARGPARMRRTEQGVRVHSGIPGAPVEQADAGSAPTVAVTR
ncbi:cell wall hydrolase [Sphingosinicella sp.]|uniref:cell wall hydrolase n=1 Tax=Sphingosinicella sp. TaxID=1917971 RepID=UPI004038456A